MQHLTDAQFRAQGEALDKAIAEHTREHNRRLFGENEMIRRKYGQEETKTMNNYKSDANYSEEAMQILHDKRRAYPLGTEIQFLDGVVIVRVEKGFEVKL